MEALIKTFEDNKYLFLSNIAEERVEPTGIIIGLVLSISNLEKILIPIYLKCLTTILRKYSNQNDPSYCFYKFYKYSNKLLESEKKIDKYFKEYIEVSKLLPDIPQKMNLKSHVYSFFCKNFNILIASYSTSLEFCDILMIGWINMSIFDPLPGILNSIIVENVCKIKNDIFENFESFLSGYKKLGQHIMNNSKPELLSLANFLYFITTELILNSNEEFILFVSRNLQVLSRFMPETNLQNIKALLSKPPNQNPIAIPTPIAQSKPQNQNPIAIPPPISQPKPPNQNPIAIPPPIAQPKPPQELNKITVAKLQNPYQVIQTEPIQPQSPRIQPHSPRFQSIKIPQIPQNPQQIPKQQIPNPDPTPAIQDLIQNLQANFEFIGNLNSPYILDLLKQGKIELPQSLKAIYAVCSDQIRLAEDNQIPFWTNLIEGLKGIIEEQDYANLVFSLNQKQASKSIPARGAPGSRRRPSSRRAVESESIRRKEFMESIENPYRDPEPLTEFKPEKAHEGYLVGSKEDASVGKDFSMCSYAEYYELLSAYLGNLIAVCSSNQEVELKNEIFLDIKSKIKEKSPSANISFVGLHYLEVYIPNTVSDISLVDYLSPDIDDLIKSCIDPDMRYDEKSNILYRHKKPIFHFVINEELEYANYSLIHKYISIQPKLKDLIYAIIIWKKSQNLTQPGFPNDLQLILILIVSFQVSELPLLPRLQSGYHEPVLINNIDIWFETNPDFQANDDYNIGTLLQSFFTTLKAFTLNSYLIDSKFGYVHTIEEENLFLPVLYPFDQKLFYASNTCSEASQKFLGSLTMTLENLEARSDFSNIFFINE